MNNKIRFVLINIGIAEHHADWNYKNVVSPFTRIYMVMDGKAKIHLPDGSYDVEKGFLYIIPAYCMHHYECNDDFTLCYIHLYERDDNDLTIGENFEFQHKIPSSDVDETIINYLLEANPNKDLKSFNPQQYNDYKTFIENVSQSSHDTVAHQMETEAILKLLISHFMKYAHAKKEQIDGRVAKALLHIRSNLSRTIEISELAELNHISVEYFTRTFTDQIGEPPIKYIQTKRIQRVQLMLMFDDMQVKDVAYAVGYNDISYFNRVFKKHVGCTPKAYRNLF